MCAENEYARLVTKMASGVPTIPVSASHNNGDWLETDIYEGELYIDSDTGKIYTRTASGIIDTGLVGSFNIYNSDGVLTGTRQVDMDNNLLWFKNTGGITTGNVLGASAGFNFINDSGIGGDGFLVDTDGDGNAYTAIMADSNTFGLNLKASHNKVFDSDITPDPTNENSSLFTVWSTRKGTLTVPRMTETERDAIVSPADYLEITNTTSGRKEFYHPVFGWAGLIDTETVTSVEKVMKTVVCGNSIAAQSKNTASGMSKGVHLTHILTSGCMQFELMTASTRMDENGIYGYSGASLATINPDLDAQWFTPIATAGIIPDLVMGYALVENDIVAGQTYAQITRSIDVWVQMVRDRWNGVKILINTPHPSISYNTTPLRTMYHDVRDYILSLDNSVDIFASDIIGYSDPLELANPITYAVEGSRAGTTLTVTSTPVTLYINSYFFIGASAFYITAFGTGTGGTGTYTVSASGTDTTVTFTHCPYTDLSVHPNAAGSLINARTNKATIERISRIWKRDLIGFSSNFNLNGTIAAGAPATGTVATSMVTTGLSSGTFVFAAEQPHVTCSLTNATNITDNGTFNFGAIAITGVNTISPFATIELISGASNLKSVMLRARITDSVGNTFRTYLQTETPDTNQDWQDGDILTIVYPETGPQSGATAGSISSLTNYVKFLTKYNGGTVEFRVLAQGYYKMS